MYNNIKTICILFCLGLTAGLNPYLYPSWISDSLKSEFIHSSYCPPVFQCECLQRTPAEHLLTNIGDTPEDTGLVIQELNLGHRRCHTHLTGVSFSLYWHETRSDSSQWQLWISTEERDCQQNLPEHCFVQNCAEESCFQSRNSCH